MYPESMIKNTFVGKWGSRRVSEWGVRGQLITRLVNELTIPSINHSITHSLIHPSIHLFLTENGQLVSHSFPDEIN
jgi:hypothetical protein